MMRDDDDYLHIIIYRLQEYFHACSFAADQLKYCLLLRAADYI